MEEFTIVPSTIIVSNNCLNDDIYILKDLPSPINISTISVSGHFSTCIILENVSKYIVLKFDDIISVKYSRKIRSLDNQVYKKPLNLRCFINQLIIILKINNNKKINIKLFKNGAFQMTGCKSIDDCNKVLQKLILYLSNKIIINNNSEQIEKYFIEDISTEFSILNFKIDMINSNFKINYKLNRNIFYEILRQEGITCRYEPCIHASINIKYNTGVKIVSIFVFQSGNIIITGACCRIDIIKTYDYINSILTKHYSKIVKRNLMLLFNDDDINDIMSEL